MFFLSRSLHDVSFSPPPTLPKDAARLINLPPVLLISFRFFPNLATKLPGPSRDRANLPNASIVVHQPRHPAPQIHLKSESFYQSRNPRRLGGEPQQPHHLDDEERWAVNRTSAYAPRKLVELRNFNLPARPPANWRPASPAHDATNAGQTLCRNHFRRPAKTLEEVNFQAAGKLFFCHHVSPAGGLFFFFGSLSSTSQQPGGPAAPGRSAPAASGPDFDFRKNGPAASPCAITGPPTNLRHLHHGPISTPGKVPAHADSGVTATRSKFVDTASIYNPQGAPGGNGRSPSPSHSDKHTVQGLRGKRPAQLGVAEGKAQRAFLFFYFPQHDHDSKPLTSNPATQREGATFEPFWRVKHDESRRRPRTMFLF